MTDQIVLGITTTPDIETLRYIHGFGDLSEDGVLSAALHLHHQKYGNKVLPLYQQQIVSVAAVKQNDSGELTLHRFENNGENEVDLLNELVALISESSSLISWDMNGFDLPLIHYRLLKHSVVSENFYKAMKFSLRQYLFNNDSDAIPDLAGLTSSLGLPLTAVLSQQEIIDSYLSKQMKKVHQTNQVKALNSYSLYLRHQLITAAMPEAEYKTACDSLYKVLQDSGQTHLKQFASQYITA